MKTIIYIGEEAEIEVYRENYPTGLDGDVLHIAGNAEVLKKLVSLGLTAVPIMNYRRKECLNRTWKSALSLSDSWFYNSEGLDLTEFQGVSIGQALKFQSTLIFNHAFQAIHNVREVLERECPKEIIVAIAYDPILAWDLDMNREVFRDWAQNEGYIFRELNRKSRDNAKKVSISLEKVDFFSGKIQISCPKFIMDTLKAWFVFLIDNYKTFCRTEFSKTKGERVLVAGFSDLNYLGQNFIQKFISIPGRKIFYIESENNCRLEGQLCKTDGRITKRENQEIKTFLTGLKKNMATLQEKAQKDHRFFYEGSFLFHLCKKYFERMCSKDFPASIQFITKVKKGVVREKINAVLIINNLMPQSVLLALVAKQKNIPALNVPHGHNQGFAKNGKVTIHPLMDCRNFPFHQTHEAVGLEVNRKLIELSGVPSEQLTLVGLQSFETSKENLEKARRQARIKLGWKEKDYFLLFATTVTDRYKDKMLFPVQEELDSFSTMNVYESIIDIFAHRPDLFLAFKFRPHDILAERTRTIIYESNLENILVHMHDLKVLLSAADVVLITRSNAGFEALFYDIPVIQYIKPGSADFLLLGYENAAIVIHDLRELPDLLEKIKNDPEYKSERITAQKKFLSKNLPRDDKTSVERTVDLIGKLTGNPNNS